MVTRKPQTLFIVEHLSPYYQPFIGGEPLVETYHSDEDVKSQNRAQTPAVLACNHARPELLTPASILAGPFTCDKRQPDFLSTFVPGKLTGHPIKTHPEGLERAILARGESGLCSVLTVDCGIRFLYGPMAGAGPVASGM